MIISLSMKLKVADSGAFSSRFEIGSEVLFHPNTWLLTKDNMYKAFKARIEKVQFSESKVTYDLAIQINDGDNNLYFYDAITIKDVDSTFVTTAEEIAVEEARNKRIEAEKVAWDARQAEMRANSIFQNGEVIPDHMVWSDRYKRWFDPNEAPTPLNEITEAPVAAEACRRMGFFCSCAIFNGLNRGKNRITMHIGNKP